MKRIYVKEEWCLGCHLCEYNCAFANCGLWILMCWRWACGPMLT